MVQRRCDIARLHTLEARVLLAGVPLSVVASTSSFGVTVTIDGTPDSDSISLHRKNSTLLITTGSGWSGTYTGRTDLIRVNGLEGNDKISVSSSIWTPVALYGDAGNDTLSGGSGNDRLFGGAGRDAFYGNAGDDVIVSVGASRNDRAAGGPGLDSFWVDSHSSERIFDVSDDEIAAGAVHRIDAFGGGASVDAGDQARLSDPVLTDSAASYANFSSFPLFSRQGPSADDIRQGDLGDCYLLASIGALAQTQPQVIRQSITDLGDGSYAVRFMNGGSASYVRVDADLPTRSDGSLAYAQLGRQNSTWVAIFEKAYAFFRTGEPTYASLEGGFMSSVFEDMGLKNSSYFKSDADLLSRLQAELDAGEAVTVGTRSRFDDDVPLLASHAYVVDEVLTDASGKPTSVRLRNPWATDGKGRDGADDGIVTINATQLEQAFWFSCVAELGA